MGLGGWLRVEDVYVVQDDGPPELGGTLHEGSLGPGNEHVFQEEILQMIATNDFGHV